MSSTAGRNFLLDGRAALAAQHEAMAERFADWGAELRAGNGTQAQIDFADAMVTSQQESRTIIGRAGAATAATPIKIARNETIAAMFTVPAEQERFTAMMHAFRSAVIANRAPSSQIHPNNIANYQNWFTTAIQEVNRLGGQMPTTTVAAQSALRAEMEAMMSSIGLPYGGDIMQQTEDKAEFSISINGVQGMNISINLPALP